MGEVPDPACRLSLRAAACMLAGDARDPIAGARVRRAVAAQFRRAGVEVQDAGDVRTAVVLALLGAPAPELPLPLELVCARASAIARNKAIDHGRRRARAPLALGDALPEPRQPGAYPGSLARPTTASSRMPRPGCAATCATGWPGSVHWAASYNALARCSSTPRPSTAPPPRRPPRSRSRPRSYSARTTRARIAFLRRP